MPNALTHSILTCAALKLQTFDTGNNKALITDYCNYPDRSDSAKYDLPTDGIQFHYLPDSSVDELYRFWKISDGKLTHCRNFVNENFYHAVNGFTRYLESAVKNFQDGNADEAEKYLGWLLHVLEDGTFGLHSLEGFLGSDPFILDRLSGKPIADMLAAIQLTEMPELPNYTPRILGKTVSEIVMRLYARFCHTAADSRQCCFRYAMERLYGGVCRCDDEVKRMFDNSVKLCADTICSIFALIHHIEFTESSVLMLTEIEPYQFPFGGCNGYRYRPYSVGCALNDDFQPIPLTINNAEYTCGIAFAAHHEGALRYFIGENIFSEFICLIGLHSSCPMENAVDITVINDGKMVKKITLSKNIQYETVSVVHPRNEFGFLFSCSPTAGEVIVIAEPRLHY